MSATSNSRNSRNSKNSGTHVRGLTAFSRPASLGLESIAFATDLAISFCAFFLLLPLTGASLVPAFAWAPAFVLLHAALWLAQRLLSGTTLGEFAWALRFKAKSGGFPGKLRGNVFRQDGLGTSRSAIAIFLTVLIWGGAFATMMGAYQMQPQWRSAENWKLMPFHPAELATEAGGTGGAADPGEKWAILPFFYSLGAWPITFAESPVFYSIPYEKGPPSRFVGRLYARWAAPEIQVLFEGPKTPHSGKKQMERTRIRQCLLAPPYSGGPGCLRIREDALSRHFREMRRMDPVDWRLRWFSVENPALPEGEQAQGIFVQAIGRERQESRFILITPRGTHQAIILSGSRTAQGAPPELARAERLLESAIGSLRVSDSLDPGRAWVDRQISSIQLDRLPDPSRSSARSAEFFLELARIQSLLVSKLSVDPKTFDTYYHLAGAAWLLIRSGASDSSEVKSDWVAAANPLFESMYHYAQDVAPPEMRNSKRMTELENLKLEAKKFLPKKRR